MAGGCDILYFTRYLGSRFKHLESVGGIEGKIWTGYLLMITTVTNSHPLPGFTLSIVFRKILGTVRCATVPYISPVYLGPNSALGNENKFTGACVARVTDPQFGIRRGFVRRY